MTDTLKDIIGLIPMPLTAKGGIDETGLKKVMDFELENGCHGVGVLAAIGESYLFSHSEWRDVIKTRIAHGRFHRRALSARKKPPGSYEPQRGEKIVKRVLIII